MSAAMAIPGNTADTFLVHLFGAGLEDDRYVVERFKAHADGDIRPWPGEAITPIEACRWPGALVSSEPAFRRDTPIAVKEQKENTLVRT